jgi:hypothetical protein
MKVLSALFGPQDSHNIWFSFWGAGQGANVLAEPVHIARTVKKRVSLGRGLDSSDLVQYEDSNLAIFSAHKIDEGYSKTEVGLLVFSEVNKRGNPITGLYFNGKDLVNGIANENYEQAGGAFVGVAGNALALKSTINSVATHGPRLGLNLELRTSPSFNYARAIFNNLTGKNRIPLKLQAGQMFEAQVNRFIGESFSQVRPQVTLRPLGESELFYESYDIIPDWLGRRNGQSYTIDAKLGKSGGYTSNQQTGYPLVERFGAKVIGKNGDALYPEGSEVGPLPHYTIRAPGGSYVSPLNDPEIED